jgi:hypothetical protein
MRVKFHTKISLNHEYAGKAQLNYSNSPKRTASLTAGHFHRDRNNNCRISYYQQEQLHFSYRNSSTTNFKPTNFWNNSTDYSLQ